MTNCGYCHAKDQIVELKDSRETSNFFQLNNHLALGEESLWQRYDPAYRAPKFLMWDEKPLTQTGPLALWDLSTGQRLKTLHGYHLGQLRGARLLDEMRVGTWGRDFLLRVWDVQTGRQTSAMPLPADLDETGTPIVTSHTCSDWTDAQFDEYLAGDSQRPSFDVTLMINAQEGSRTESFLRQIKAPVSFTPYTFDYDRAFHQIPAPFRELEGIEASYSDSTFLADGRLLVGGITYGSPDHTYIWDGGLQLLILYTWLNDGANLEIDGEVTPGVIQLRNHDTAVTFNVQLDN